VKIPHHLRRTAGNSGEKLAARHLGRHGLKAVASNYQCRQGEIDLIAMDGETLVFIEVKLRQGDSHGSAIETVTKQKQQRIILCARHFLMQHSRFANYPCRFDIVGITASQGAQGYGILWLKDAFQAAW
jgi:putative endonuclease